MEEEPNKATPSTTSMTWIGLHFITSAMAVSKPQEKINEVLTICSTWLRKFPLLAAKSSNLLGKLFHETQCVRTARFFISRILITLRATQATGWVPIDPEFKLDIQCFRRFVPSYNGIHLMNPPVHITATIELDSCLTGCGAIFDSRYYHTPYPDFMLDQCKPICH